MSKRKNIDITPEAENEVAENLIEQTTLENLDGTPVVESSIKTKGKVTLVYSTRANKSGKMGVERFLMLYPQDYYMETLLRYYYRNDFYTKNEWFQRIEDILNTPIYN